tara:strand:+ start:367 stop:1578 length:1212 start_codon:yes stop_codon:yes gene_type:complete
MSSLSNIRKNELRELIPALQNKKYFNYGGQGPLPSPSLKAIQNSWEEIQELGPFTNDVWPYVMKEITTTKRYLAKICGVSASHIALTENVTSGCILPIWGIPFSADDRILISDCEHPGIIAACKELAHRKKLHIDVLKVQQLRNGANNRDITRALLIQNLKDSLKPRTKLVVLSHILWNTGQIIPIEAVSQTLKNHGNKPFLLVDAAQSFGQIPIKKAVASSDIYAFTGHKWACGPEGLGGMAVSDRILKEGNPTFIGWRSLQTEEGIYINSPNPFHMDARRFEIATSCIPLLAGLRCSLDLLEKEGTEEKRLKKIQSLSLKIWEGLNESGKIHTILKGPPPAGLVSFDINNEEASISLVKSLGKKRLWIRVLEDPKWLRACVHITTNEEEVSSLIQEIIKLI